MRNHFHEDLESLAEQLKMMCLRDRTAVAVATEALLDADVVLAERAIDISNDVHALREDCEHRAVTLLALQAPVASELRQVFATIQIVDDLIRMAALSEHIACLARRRYPEHVVPDGAREVIADMGAAAVAMATGALEVLDSRDPDDAVRLADRDDTMNRLHESLLAGVLADAWNAGTGTAVDLTLLGRYYERFADRTVQIGQRIVAIPLGELSVS